MRTADHTLTTTRCQHWRGVLKWTSLNRSPVMATRCHQQEGQWGSLRSHVQGRGGAGICTVSSNASWVIPLWTDWLMDRHVWNHYLPTTSLRGGNLYDTCLDFGSSPKPTGAKVEPEDWSRYQEKTIAKNNTSVIWSWIIRRFKALWPSSLIPDTNTINFI